MADRLIADLRLNPSKHPDALGQIGSYDVLGVIGAGAMGVVLKAFDARLHRTVAIKVLSSHLLTSEEARLRFHREARSAAQFSHPNVVTIFAVDDHHGIPYLVMEFVDGMSLDQRIAESAPLLSVDILRLSQQIAIGLAAAHRNGVVHRDIKPANIMLENGGEQVKITDFGLAKAAVGDSDLTSFGKLLGTPSYMSPEQVSGDPLDGRSDLYSLGCVMYAMIAGSPPFRGENCLAVAHRIRTEPPRPLREKFPDVPRFLEAIILQLLEKNPDKRFQSAGELAAVLSQRLAKVNLGGSTYIFSGADTTRVMSAPGKKSTKRKWVGIGLLLLCSAVLMGAFLTWEPPSAHSVPSATQPGDVRPHLTVSPTDPDADARTINQALKLVDAPWTVIEVLDDSLYHEKISLDEPRFHGLTLVSRKRATLQDDPIRIPRDIFDTDALIDINGVSDVTINGFKLLPAAIQWGIRIRGHCPGLDISQIHSRQPPNAERTFLYGHEGASGTIDKPIRLHHLVVSCAAGGMYFTANKVDTDHPIENIDIEDNLLEGVPASVLLCFTEVPHRALPSHVRINVRRNVIVSGRAGVHLQLTHPDCLQAFNISHNTFANLGALLSTYGNEVVNSDLLFDSNLVLNTNQVIDSDLGLPAKRTWFQNMHWEISPGCNRSAIEEVATLHPEIPVQSRAIGDAEFLHPQPGALPDLKGAFPGAYERIARETPRLPADVE